MNLDREILIARQVAGIIANYVCFLEGADEESLNPDVAVKMMEFLGAELDELDKGFLRHLVDAFPVVAERYDGEARELVRDIPYGFYLEETLAADDPLRLAELEAMRDARG
ncbi:MAG: hypothetical protein PGN16_12460 [Sphingomonas phyllosphaerae]|uniref:hypothetical protein n=1 Tax=Sphingomonas phyllosphaerae TaxID=257003 RepID=UPI002FF6B130